MSHLRLILVVCGSLCAMSSDRLDAQVPPHAPGTICYTPQFWCWAKQPGPPGGVCYCPSAYGWVPGRLG